MGEKGYELFFGKQSPFSHHHACRFKLENHTFHCMEQYMMYKKAEVFNDENIMHQVLDSRQPGEIKRLGRQVKDFDILKWMKVAVDIVKTGNRAKFRQNARLYNALYYTWPKQMVEASPSDTRWGIGLSADNPDAHDESKWRGRNLLGKLLTNLRDEMLIEDKEIKELTLPLLENDQSAIEKDLLEKERDKPRYGSRDRGKNWRSEQNLQSSVFEFFWGSESPFSNFHETEFEIDGKKFCCIEHFMLYGKADLFRDKETLEHILKITRTDELKNKIDVRYYNGKRWSESRTDIYKHAVKEKFKQNPDLMQVLLATFPKIIQRVDMKGQRRLESNPDSFKRDEWRHWSEFALMEVRDEILGKDSGAEMSFNSSDARHKSRRDKKRAGDDHRDEKNRQKKTKHHQSSPDHYVNDVSNLFDEDLNIQSMESDDCSQNEAQNGSSSSKNSKPVGHKKMEVDSVEHEVDWFDGQSTSETSNSKPRKNSLVSTGSESTGEKRERKRSGSESSRETRNEKGPTKTENARGKWDEKRPTGSESSREKRTEKGQTGSENSRGKESFRTENSQGTKKSKKKKGENVSETYNSKDRHLKTTEGTPKKSSRESSRDVASCRRDKSAETHQDETKPTKNYRKMKLSSLPNEKKYTIIQNTDPLSFEAECKFTIDDVVFNSVNHFTAYRKAELFEDDFTKNKIKKASDSQVIRKLDGEVKKFDPTTWFANHVEIHKQACEAKFLQNPGLKLKLYDTYPTLIHRSGKSVKGRVTGIDHASLSKQDRSNKQDINNVLHDVRDELMRKEELID